MNLEQFREALASEATKKTARLERQNKELRRMLAERMLKIREHEEDLRFLFNRCYAINGGPMCLWCGMKEKCGRLRSVGKPAKEVKT